MKTVLLVFMAFMAIFIMFFLPIFIIYDTFFLKQFVRLIDGIIDMTDFYKGIGLGAFAMLILITIIGAARNWK